MSGSRFDGDEPTSFLCNWIPMMILQCRRRRKVEWRSADLVAAAEVPRPRPWWCFGCSILAAVLEERSGAASALLWRRDPIEDAAGDGSSAPVELVGMEHRRVDGGAYWC